jgi:hypothetical protein
MTFKHTPGPWRVDTVDRQLIRSSEDYGVAFALASWGAPPIPSEEYEANARLIAAAPDLLEACREAESFFIELNDHLQVILGGQAKIISTLEAAINAAEADND